MKYLPDSKKCSLSDFFFQIEVYKFNYLSNADNKGNS